MGSVDTGRPPLAGCASPTPPPPPATAPRQLVPSRGCAPPARLSASAAPAGASPPQLPNPYERAMAAASGAAAAAAAAASAASAIFGPCGDAGVAFPQCPHLPVPPPVPPVPPLLHLPRPRFPRPRASAPTSSPASGPTQDMSDGDSVVRGAYSVQVRVFPDGRVERISRSFEAESGRLAGRAPPRPRPPSPAPPQRPPTTALPAPPGVESAAAGDAPDERSVISNKSFQALPSLSEESAWEDSDERSSIIITADDDAASTVTATKVGPCWTSCPAEADEAAVHGGDASGRFPDMELLKDMLRGMFQSFRRDAKEPTEQYVSPEEGTATHRATDVGFTTEFDPKFIRPNIEEEGMIEMDDEAVQTQDVEMRESTTDMVTVTDEEEEEAAAAEEEEDMAEDEEEEEEEAKMDVEVETEPVAAAEPVPHRSWSPPPPAPPPPPRSQPLPPPVQPSPPPPTAQARVAAFAASAAPPLPPGAVFFESGTYVADGADPEYVERMMTMRETAMRAAERAVSNACGCFSSFFGNYSCAGERRP